MKYAPLEKKIRITFKDKNLLDQAFVHKSWVNEHREAGKEDNERLEFLGDAVLELVVTEFLYEYYPEQKEGELTNWRSALVKGRHLSEIARALELGQFLYLSRGEEQSQGREKSYILANTLEALIGSIYVEKGYRTAHKFIQKFILKHLEDILEKDLHIDPKSRFQEIAQEKLGVTPIYILLEETGPDHAKVFTVSACLNNEKIAQGSGTSKQNAEENAAYFALKKMEWDKIKVKGAKFHKHTEK